MVGKNEFVKTIWSSDDELVPNRTWQWWFWLFFIKGGEKPRQLMTLWSAKECPHISVNGHPVVNGGLVFKGENEDFLKGAAATWYFDGSKMHHFFNPSHLKIKRGETNEIATECRKNVFSGDVKNFRVVSSEPDYDFRISQNETDDLPYERSNFPLGMNFKIAKIDRCSLKGELEGEKVRGYAYFQKVVCNAPATSWYWGMHHFENGANLSYFVSKVGKQNFNFSDRPARPFGIALNRGLYFDDGKKPSKFDNMKITRRGNELPVWDLIGRGKEGVLSAELSAYARACWRFRKGGVLSPTLHYNEYPTTVTKLELNGTSILEGLGKNYGNTEHSWGTLI